MTLEMLGGEYAVCRLKRKSLPEGGFVSLTVTGDEISLVCETDRIPADCTVEKGWRILRIKGVLDFSLVGVLAGLTGVLARAGVSVFAVSTYDTDYLLIKTSSVNRAAEALEAEGYEIVGA